MDFIVRKSVVLSLLAGLSGGLAAQEVVSEETPLVTPVVISTPAAVPVAVSTYPVIGIPVAIPVPVDRSQDVVEWKELRGTVKSVDRNNLIMTVQDDEGKAVRVAYNNNIRIFRRGQEVAYSDVEPNDPVQLQYAAGRSSQNK